MTKEAGNAAMTHIGSGGSSPGAHIGAPLLLIEKSVVSFYESLGSACGFGIRNPLNMKINEKDAPMTAV